MRRGDEAEGLDAEDGGLGSPQFEVDIPKNRACSGEEEVETGVDSFTSNRS